MNKIELNFKMNKYSNTFQVGSDFRKMWNVNYKLHAEDPDKVQKIKDMQSYFD